MTQTPYKGDTVLRYALWLCQVWSLPQAMVPALACFLERCCREVLIAVHSLFIQGALSSSCVGWLLREYREIHSFSNDCGLCVCMHVCSVHTYTCMREAVAPLVSHHSPWLLSVLRFILCVQVFASVCVHPTCAVPADQKQVLDPLELESRGC